MVDGSVVPPKMAYPFVRVILADEHDAAYMVRCDDCDGAFRVGDLVAMAWSRGKMRLRYFHPDCYHNGAPWRREAAARAKEAAK